MLDGDSIGDTPAFITRTGQWSTTRTITECTDPWFTTRIVQLSVTITGLQSLFRPIAPTDPWSSPRFPFRLADLSSIRTTITTTVGKQLKG